MNYRLIGFLINLFIGLAFADPIVEQKLVENPVIETDVKALTLPGIDAGRVMKKAEKYKTLISQTIRNKRIAWFSGGVLASGCLLYLLTDGFCSSDKTDGHKAQNSTKRNIAQADEAFNEWWEEEKEARRSLWGGTRRGIADGLKIGLVSVVVGLLLKAFDNATNSLSNFSDTILGCDEDILFERVNRSVLFSFDCLAHSLQILVHELAILSSGNGKAIKIPSFFYDAVIGDLQALSLQLEEHMGLVFAIVSLREKNAHTIGNSMEVMASVVDDVVAYTMLLVQHGANIDFLLVRQEALITEKKVFRAIERYLVTSKSVLFENA